MAEVIDPNVAFNEFEDNIDKQQQQNQNDDITMHDLAQVPGSLPIVVPASGVPKKPKIKQLKPKGTKKQGASKTKGKSTVKSTPKRLPNNSNVDVSIAAPSTAYNSEQTPDQMCKKCNEYRNMLFQLANMVAPTSSDAPPNLNFVTVKNFIKFGKVQQQTNVERPKKLMAHQQKQLSSLSDQRIQLMKIKERLVQARLPTQDLVETVSGLIQNCQQQRYEIQRLQEQNRKLSAEVRRLSYRNTHADYDALKAQNAENERLNAELTEQVQEIMDINRQLQENCDGFKELNEILSQSVEQARHDGAVRAQLAEEELARVLTYFRRNGRLLEDLVMQKLEALRARFQAIQAAQEDVFIELWRRRNAAAPREDAEEEY